MEKTPLQDRVILIIGAGRWPGPGLSLALASQGAGIAANDLSPILLDPICEAAKIFPGKIKAYIADATKGMPLRAMLDEVMEDWGRIDVLINNPRVLPTKTLLDMDEWDWQRTLDMNLNGPFLVSKLVARTMQERGQGTILNIVDTSEILREPGKAAYAASQFGFLALSQAAAQELIAYNIRVYTLCPGRDILHNPLPLPEVMESLKTAQAQEGNLSKIVTRLCSSSADHPAEQTIIVN
jgi:NAD(P)-dependent dehydrogenase (short-subunit alcohol dehydrogenase family)